MARTGRPPSNLNRKPAHLALQQKYIDTIDRVAYDPFFQKRKVGARSIIMEEALDLYFAKRNIEVKESEPGK